MGIHLSQLKVKDYRGIKDVTLDGLNHINILTGKNNAGKTSLLETLCVIDNPLDLSNWYASSEAARIGGLSLYKNILRLFPIDVNKNEIFFSYNYKGEEHCISVKGEESRTTVPKKELMRLNGYIPTGNNRIGDNEMLEMRQLSVEIEDNGEKANYIIYEQQNRLVNAGAEKANRFPVFFLSAGERYGGAGFYFKEIIKNKESTKRMVDILRKFDKHIIGITLIDDECYLYTDNNDSALPLSVVGEGMKKAVYILAAIIIAKDGIVLIDEFETSIHEQAMRETFSIIFKTALEENVQIFMSSHSTVAISKIVEIADCAEILNLYTLYKEDEFVVRRLNGNDVKEALNMGVAIR